MIAASILAAIAGIWLVGFTVLSAIRTVVLPRAISTFITGAVFLTVRRLFGLLTFAVRSYETRDRVLALYAPVSLVLLPLVWLALIMIGFTLLFWAAGFGSLVESLAASGSSVTTLGSTPVNGVVHRLLSFTEAGLGLLVIALLITYLPTLYSDFSRRETLVILLEVRAGSPPAAVELLLRAHRIRGLSQLGDDFGQWETWFAELEQSHTAFPALTFFRSTQPERSWITAAGTVLDAAALYASTLEVPRDPRADLCLRAGYIALRRVASFYGAEFDWTPQATDPIALARTEFDQAYEALTNGGVPVRADRDAAWKDFAGWRVNYDTPLLHLSELVTAPYAPWTADRSPVTRERIRVSKWGWRRRSKAPGRVSLPGTEEADMALLKRRDDKINVLAEVPLFVGLSKKDLGEIARLVTEVQYQPGEHLTQEGEIGREAMVVLAGKGTVRRGGRKIAEVSAGDVVGEMSLVTHRPRNASVTADTTMTALVMSTREFSSLMDEHPQVGLKILSTVADRVIEATGAD